MFFVNVFCKCFFGILLKIVIFKISGKIQKKSKNSFNIQKGLKVRFFINFLWS